MAVGVEEALADRSGHKQRAGSAQMLKLHAREKKGKAVMEDPEAAGGAQQDVAAGTGSSSSGSDSGGAPTTSSRGGTLGTSRKTRRKVEVAAHLPTVTEVEPAASSVPLPPTSAVMTSKQGQVASGGRSSSKRRATGDKVIEDSQKAQDAAATMLQRKRARQAMSASCTAASGLLQASVPRSGSMPTKFWQPTEEHTELQTRRSESMPAAFSSQEPRCQPDQKWRAPANPTCGTSPADSALEQAPELESNESSCSRFESDCQDLMQAVAMPHWIARLLAERTHISEPDGARKKGCEEEDHEEGMPFGAATQGADTAGGASFHPAGPGISISLQDQSTDCKGDAVAGHASAAVDTHAASHHHADGEPRGSQEISQGTQTRMTGMPAGWLDLLNEADWEARPHVQSKPGSNDEEEDEEQLDSVGNAAAAGLAFALMSQASRGCRIILWFWILSPLPSRLSAADTALVKEQRQFLTIWTPISLRLDGVLVHTSSPGAQHVYAKGHSRLVRNIVLLSYDNSILHLSTCPHSPLLRVLQPVCCWLP
eukprot:SM000243S08593  [mRNA]  locus=s243:142422:146626:- [translate_table: standard]